MPSQSFDMNVVDPLELVLEDVDKPEKEEQKPPQTDPAVVAKLNELQNTANQSAVLTNLLAIPEVQEILRARQAGQPVKIMAGDQSQQAPSQNEPAPDWEKLKEDPEQFTNFLMGRIEKGVNASMSKMLQEAMKPVMQKVTEVESSVVANNAEKIQNSIEEVKKKYPDFETLRPELREQNAKTPGLTAEQLYILVKHQRGEQIVQSNQLASERPTDAAARRAIQPLAGKTYPRGRAGFQQAINDSLKTQDLEDFLSPT